MGIETFVRAELQHLPDTSLRAVWPDAFSVIPPCCPRLSHDEGTFAEMLRLAPRGERVAFDRLLAEMLAADPRERLFHAAQVLSRLLPS